MGGVRRLLRCGRLVAQGSARGLHKCLWWCVTVPTLLDASAACLTGSSVALDAISTATTQSDGCISQARQCGLQEDRCCMLEQPAGCREGHH